MKKLPVGFQIMHWIIIVNFLLEIGYGSYMVFYGLAEDKDERRPLFGKADDIDFETMMKRRLYASETWIAITGLSVYLGVTEFLPRILQKSARPRLFKKLF